MNEQQIEALANMNKYDLGDGCEYSRKVLYNEGGHYRGIEFLMQLSEKVPELFKVFWDFEDRSIPNEVYINAGLYSNQGWLLSYMLGAVDWLNNFHNLIGQEISNKLELEYLPKIIELHWDALGCWVNFANQEKWVEMAVGLRGSSFQFASYNLRNSENFVIRLLIKQPSCFRYATDRLRDCIAVALPAVILDLQNFKFVGLKAQENYELGHFAIINDPTNIQYLHASNLNLKYLSEIAIRQGVNKSYLPLELRNPKKMLDKISIKAELNMSYGATPPRLLILENLDDKIETENLIIVIVIESEIKRLALKCSRIPYEVGNRCLLNIDLKNSLHDSLKFMEWQDKVSEKGALKVSIKNVGIILNRQ